MWKFALAFVLIAACVQQDDDLATHEHGDPEIRTTIRTPIGLAIDIEDGVGKPLSVRANQTFYVNQIDMRAHIETAVDEGVSGLARTGDFAGLDWRDTALVDESFENLPNPDGTFTRRRFYRQSHWMDEPSLFLIEQLDRNGRVRGVPVAVGDGLVDRRTPGPADTWFARRLRGIQWANNCVSKTDCTTANDFLEEALVELRYANGPKPTFQIDPATTQLRVHWTANPDHTYTIPVEQVAHPEWDYGFGIDLQVTTPPNSDGTYSAGQTIGVQFTLRDGAGKDLAADGGLPTYADYVSGNDPPGVDYWNQAEQHMTYYRRKHTERQMIIALDGPMQDVAVVHDTFDFVGALLAANGNTITIATPAQNGFVAQAQVVPNGFVLLGILPADTPVSNTAQFTLPPDAPPGTYKIAMKARRTYLGEDIPRTAVISIQVGTRTHTTSSLDTGGCTRCHTGADDLTQMSHGFSVNERDVCTTCHPPLPFEPEGTVYVRVHFIHSRSGRLNASPEQCSLCHLNVAGIQRTSKSACLSCHKSYPADHVAKYGPITDMYIGGALDNDSFLQCTSSCHRNHPDSGL